MRGEGAGGVTPSTVVLAAIGGLFVLKYGERLVGAPLAFWAAAAYGLVYLSALGYVARQRVGAPGWVLAGVVVGIAVGVAYGAPATNGLARAPAINEWLGALSAGTFPYGQPSAPSSLPGLFLLASPFWATGAVWLIPPVGLALLLWLMSRVAGSRGGVGVVATVGFVPVWYEVILHSELVANGAVGLAALLVSEALRRRGDRTALAVSVLVGGVALSTRLSVAIAFAVYGAWVLRRQPRWAVWWGGGALAVVALTVAPFAIWEPDVFGALGPFSVQGRFIPLWAGVPGVGAALVLGWTAADLRAVVGRAGALLVVLAGCSFSLMLAQDGPPALWDSRFDITYLVLGAPFLLASLPPWRDTSFEQASPSADVRAPG
jgi:hypothetical protein